MILFQRKERDKLKTMNYFKNKLERIRKNSTSEVFWKKVGKDAFNKINENRLVIVVLFFTLIVGFIRPRFWSGDNWLNIIELNTPVAIVALGMTLVILTGGIDLSVGSVIGLVGASALVLHKSGVSMSLSILISILIGTLIGTFQGFLVGYLRLIPFIVTLVGMLIFRGVSTVILDEKSSSAVGNQDLFNFSIENKFLGISVQVWVLLIVALFLMFILKYTIFGRHIYSVGGNRRSSVLSGVNAKLIEISVYTIIGTLTSIAAIMYLSNTQNVAPMTGSGKELDVIAMVVLGGTNLTGGKGSIMKTFVGWLILSILYNALLLMGYSTAYQKIFSGSIILAAIIFDSNQIDLKVKIKNIKLKIKNKREVKNVKK